MSAPFYTKWPFNSWFLCILHGLQLVHTNAASVSLCHTTIFHRIQAGCTEADFSEIMLSSSENSSKSITQVALSQSTLVYNTKCAICLRVGNFNSGIHCRTSWVNPSNGYWVTAAIFDFLIHSIVKACSFRLWYARARTAWPICLKLYT